MQKGSAAEYPCKVQWRVTLKYSTAIQKSTGPSPKYCSINLKKKNVLSDNCQKKNLQVSNVLCVRLIPVILIKLGLRFCKVLM